MSLVEHAENELRLSGLLEIDSDYDGMVGKCVLELMRTFAAQRHSGYSAWLVRDIFYKLSQFKPLTGLTDDPAEWVEVGEDSRGTCFQSRRQYSCFSYDGGKTYYDLDEEGRPTHVSLETRSVVR